jgi:hypothetical protein
MSTKHETRDRFHCSVKHVRRLVTAIVIALLSPLASAQVGLLQSGSNLIQSVDRAPVVGIFFQTMHGRSASPAIVQVTLTGSMTDDNGSRASGLPGGSNVCEQACYGQQHYLPRPGEMRFGGTVPPAGGLQRNKIKTRSLHS